MFKFTQIGLWEWLGDTADIKHKIQIYLHKIPPPQLLHQMPTTQETCAKIGKYYTGKCTYNVSEVMYVKFMEPIKF